MSVVGCECPVCRHIDDPIPPQATLRVDWTAEHCGDYYLACTEIDTDGAEGDRVLVRVIDTHGDRFVGRTPDREVTP